jgi:hypothetical protein
MAFWLASESQPAEYPPVQWVKRPENKQQTASKAPGKSFINPAV